MAAARGTLDIRVECVGRGDTTLLLSLCVGTRQWKLIVEWIIAETSNVCPQSGKSYIQFPETVYIWDEEDDILEPGGIIWERLTLIILDWERWFSILISRAPNKMNLNSPD